MHVYFVQTVDLDTGINNATLTGLSGYIQDIVNELPSAASQPLSCSQGAVGVPRLGLQSCVWHGLAPNVLATEVSALTKGGYKDWLSFNVSSVNNTASFSIQGRNTKACRLIFDNFVSDLSIEEAASDPRYDPVSEKGIAQIRLASRTWDKMFHVNVTWADQEAKNQTGRIMCMWSDANQRGTIPAFDEARRFAPVWTAVIKADDGLVEGWKDFVV